MLFSVMVPNMILNCMTIALDYATKVKINREVVPLGAELKSIMIERKRIDQIAKRAIYPIYINVGLFVPWNLYTGNSRIQTVP